MTEVSRKGRTSKGFASALSIFLILAAANAYGREKKGAQVMVALLNGESTFGELIAVKHDSVLILNQLGRDASYDFEEIQAIEVFRKSKAGNGALMGLLVGGATGFIGGSVISKAQGDCPDCEAPLTKGFYTMIGLGLGSIGGFIAGISAGMDLTIQLDGVTGKARSAALSKLKKYARYKDFR